MKKGVTLNVLPSTKIMPNSKPKECIIGIDPGLANIGIAALEDDSKILLTGTITTEADNDHAIRFKKIRDQLLRFMDRLDRQPTAIYFEENFNLDIKINIVLGILIGTMMPTKILGINPKRVKQMVCGKGSADKQSIINFISAKFNTKLHCPHQADAALIALAGMSGKWEKNERRTRIHRSKTVTN